MEIFKRGDIVTWAIKVNDLPPSDKRVKAGPLHLGEGPFVIQKVEDTASKFARSQSNKDLDIPMLLKGVGHSQFVVVENSISSPWLSGRWFKKV